MNRKLDHLRVRARLLRQTRAFFDEIGFIEVQPPCLSRDLIVDAHIDPVIVPGQSLGLPSGMAAATYYLQSSAELAMKRLLAQGVGSMYSIGPVFRAGERSPRHNVEFTMLEWYAVGASMQDAIKQTVSLVQRMLGNRPTRVVTYRELFQQTLGFDPIETPVQRLEIEVAKVDADLATSLLGQRDELLDVLLTERIEPAVATESLLIRNYPLSQAALARRCDDDPQTAERFEWMIDGLELANGYGELIDADELQSRSEANNQKRIAAGRRPLASDSRLVEAMRSGLPPCAGVALGFDRLVMLAVGSREIGDVLVFPIEDA